MDDCIFCKIIKKELPSKTVFESEDIIAFYDINPASDIHILITPKEHISSMSGIDESKGGLLVNMYKVAQKLVIDNNLQDGAYRVLVNGGKAQLVPHLHFHFLGGQWRKFV